MRSGTNSFLAKIIIIGDAGVGKTSLRRSYLGEGFRQNYQPTLGADFGIKKWVSDNASIKFMIWDISGEDRFSDVRPEYYVSSIGAVLVYDLLRNETFQNLENWLHELITHAKDTLVSVVFMGNKIDLLDDQGVYVNKDEFFQRTTDLLRGYPEIKNCGNFLTSALTGKNVEIAFTSLAKSIEDYLLGKN